MIKFYYDNSIQNKPVAKSIEMVLKSSGKKYQRIVVGESNLQDIENIIGGEYTKPFITDGSRFVIGYDPVSIHKIIK